MTHPSYEVSMKTAPIVPPVAAVQRPREVTTLRAFIEKVERRCSSGDRGAFWACAPDFEALVRSGVAEELLRAELSCIASDPRHLAMGNADSLVIAGTEHFQLILKLFRPGPSA